MPTSNTSMQGKVCIVTGANSGIGKATALGLAQMGATVIMVCRNQIKGEEAQNEIKEKSENDAVELMLADLSSQRINTPTSREFPATLSAIARAHQQCWSR